MKPIDVAKILVEKFSESDLFSEVAMAGPYVNFNLNPVALFAASVGSYFEPKAREDMFSGNIVIEFSSPNTNKPQHLGHVRNNCIGDAVSKILDYVGYDVTKFNLVNDRGIHICKSMLAYKLKGEGATPESTGIKSDHFVGNYYVLFNTIFEEEYHEWLETEQAQEEFEKWKNSSTGKKALKSASKEIQKLQKTIKDEEKLQKKLEKLTDFSLFKSEQKEYYFNHFSPIGAQATELLVKWEEGDEEVRDLWKMMNDWVFKGFNETYKTLGIEFDVYQYESQVYQAGKDIIIKGFEDGIFGKEDNGAISLDLSAIGEQGKKILLRANGTSMYMTQDIGVALGRVRDYNPDRSIYVVASEQNRHFKVLFGICNLLHPEQPDVFHHLSYGMVNLPTGRMKSREGTVVDADDLIMSIAKDAEPLTMSKWPDLPADQVSERTLFISLAALKFYITSFTPDTTVTFDVESAISFKGKTGTYLLYTYARTRSIFRKADVDFDTYELNYECLSALETPEEMAVAYGLLWLPSEIVRAAKSYDTSKVADGIYRIASAFSTFYKDKNKHPIISCEDENVKNARLSLVKAVGNSVKLGLRLLGIDVLEEM
eukprot:TRINITY_DN4355_c0_g2_i2.p1 TRINITY_DN4355_c0_g2~~TRINITY_DN4355_c0_g2_i2.p1  ORF type:complete len:599 (-),score=169.18 TRINITY_DN4355_c0_g2_i2:13-1809(-)